MMPEGPEVRAVVDQFQAGGIGQRLTDVQFVSGRYVKNGLPDGFREFAATMTPVPEKRKAAKKVDRLNWFDRSMMENEEMPVFVSVSDSDSTVDLILDWNCKGKFIYILLGNGARSNAAINEDFQRSIWITLGMSGRFLSQAALKEREAQGKSSHIRWYLELMKVEDTTSSTEKGKTTKIFYSDTRNFGTLKFCLSRQALANKLQSLGPDMLTTCTEQDFLNIVAGHKNQDKNICVFLMDQSNLAGIGNYILAEGLYRANIDPFSTLSELNMTQQQHLFRELQAVSNESYQSQTDATVESFVYLCYGQQFCKRLGSPVRKEINGPHGRTIWYTDEQLFMPRREREQQTLILRGIRTEVRAGDADTGTAMTRKTMTTMHKSPPSEGRGLTPTLKASTPDNAQPVKQSKSSGALESAGAAATPGNAKLASILLANSSAKLAGLDASNGLKKVTFDDKSTLAVTSDSDSLVLSLLSGLTDPGWKDVFRHALQKSDFFMKLALFLEEERLRGETIFPSSKEIFSALNLCPLDAVKVVIVGQDPYHGLGQAHGLAFSVRKGIRAPPSLQNIFKEVIDDVGIDAPKHGNLEFWARQGVLLLNTVLTVREGEANSHAGKGWEEVTDMIIRESSARNQRADSNGLVFLLWGNAAAKKVESVIDEDAHIIIQTSHPSPLGATKTKSPFLGSKCFSMTNKALIAMGRDPVDWSVE